VTVKSALNEISELTKMAVKHKGEGKSLERNATSFSQEENQQEKQELDGSFWDGKCHPFPFL
jgi:hypothetical protein